MAPEGDIAPLLNSLCDPEAAKRQIAAAVLFERGSESIRATTDAWLGLPALADLLERDPQSRNLKITVGVAVAPDWFERIRAANGGPRLATIPPDQDAREFELEFPGGVRLDILTTREPSGGGPIARYLRKFGPGIQQVEMATANVDRATEVLRGAFAVQPIYDQTRPGAEGTRVNFFLIQTGDRKVLVELVQAAANPPLS